MQKILILFLLFNSIVFGKIIKEELIEQKDHYWYSCNFVDNNNNSWNSVITVQWGNVKFELYLNENEEGVKIGNYKILSFLCQTVKDSLIFKSRVRINKFVGIGVEGNFYYLFGYNEDYNQTYSMFYPDVIILSMPECKKMYQLKEVTDFFLKYVKKDKKIKEAVSYLIEEFDKHYEAVIKLEKERGIRHRDRN